MNEKAHGEKVILIRKQDMNLHKYDTRNKNLMKMLSGHEQGYGASLDYIDELDLEMLRRK